MLLDAKPLDALKEEDLARLVTEKVKELRVIDYKSQLPSDRPDDKREFLYDVSSFANARGGHLLYGVDEVAGEPVALPGVEAADAEKVILRLEQVIRDGIVPRLPVQSWPISLKNGRVVFVIKIPRSWAGPHMVTFSGSSRFYSRNSAGKYPLDVYEIRSAFAASESAIDRIKRYRAERLSAIVSGDTPHEIREAPKVVLHILPLISFALEKPQIDLLQIRQREAQRQGGFRLSPLYESGCDVEWNFDGFLTYHSDMAYLQVFRDGCIETLHYLWGEGSHDIRFYSECDRMVLQGLKKYLGFLKDAEVEPPYVVMLSVVEANGVIFTYRGGPSEKVNKRETLIFPDVLIEDPAADLAEVMRPALNVFYCAAGLPTSPNYDESGRWIGRPY